MRHKLLDRFFEVAIIFKGFDGILEFIGGIIFLFVKPATIDKAVIALTQHELSTDPHDFFANWLAYTAHHLSVRAEHFAAAYLIIDAIVKIAIVIGLLKNKLDFYILAFIVYGFFICYKTYRLYIHYSVPLLLFTLFDVIVLFLVWKEYSIRKNK